MITVIHARTGNVEQFENHFNPDQIRGMTFSFLALTGEISRKVWEQVWLPCTTSCVPFGKENRQAEIVVDRNVVLV